MVNNNFIAVIILDQIHQYKVTVGHLFSFFVVAHFNMKVCDTFVKNFT